MLAFWRHHLNHPLADVVREMDPVLALNRGRSARIWLDLLAGLFPVILRGIPVMQARGQLGIAMHVRHELSRRRISVFNSLPNAMVRTTLCDGKSARCFRKRGYLVRAGKRLPVKDRSCGRE